MGQIVVTLNDERQAEISMAFVRQLNFVEKVEEQVQAKETKNITTFEEVKALADQFPSDKKWTYNELTRVLPSDLKVKVEILNNELFIMPSPYFFHQK